MIGHLFGAAGAVEALATALTLHHGVIPPTINLHNPDPECDLDYVPNVARTADVRTGLSNSMGLGGHNACLILRRVERPTSGSGSSRGAGRPGDRFLEWSQLVEGDPRPRLVERFMSSLPDGAAVIDLGFGYRPYANPPMKKRCLAPFSPQAGAAGGARRRTLNTASIRP